ncbi:MAG: ferric iron uptake transcriptional regulator [Gammaproteobacteria bacterium]|nr:MAG: ferric iron uptake transcriptional regulator [Gammaproteobacteria bacterium]
MQHRELKRAGLRATGPRLKILDALKEHAGSHLSAEDLYRHLREAGEEVGLATVYRVLTQFEEAGLVTRHNFEGDHAVFELRPRQHHDHMVCLETGDVVEFLNEDIERLQEEVAARHGYELVDHRLVLYVRPKRGR